MHRWWILLSLMWLFVAVHPPVPSPSAGLNAGVVEGADDLHPTNSWLDFLGKESRLDGQPLPPGSVVRAYDPTGVLAGRTEVSLAGWYLVSVYRDDPMTLELDEGAEEGDRIAFTVDHYPAVPLGPDPPVWVQNPPDPGYVRVELSACTLAGDFDCDCRVTVADLMRQARSFGVSRGQAGYYPPFDRDADDDIDSGDLQDVAGGWRTACQSQ